MWDAFIELIRALIFAVAHACGGSIGGSIALVSFAVRILLIPLSLRVMQRAREKQAVLERLKPQIARIERRYGKDSASVATETLALYRQNGIGMFDRLTLVSFAVQAPLLCGLFAAVRAGLGAGRRFLWIVDLSAPDGWLALGAAGLVGLTVWLAPQAPGASAAMVRMSVLLAAGTTVLFLVTSSSAIAVSVAAGAVGAGVQGWVGRRRLNA